MSELFEALCIEDKLVTDPISPATNCRNTAYFSSTLSTVIKPMSGHCNALLALQCSLIGLKKKLHNENILWMATIGSRPE